MNSSMVVRCFKEEITMWYDEKDLAAEAVKDSIFMGGNENSRPDTVFIVSAKYGVKLRVCPSGLRTWEGKNAEAFENCYSKVVKMGYGDFICLSLEERENYTKQIIEEWDKILELINQLKSGLEQLKTALQKEAGNKKLLKIGTGINIKTERPNFQIWLKVSSLSVSVIDCLNGKSVVLKGELCLAKNWRELQEGNYDEVVASLVPPFGAPGNTRHKFYLTGHLSPYATQDLKNIAKALLKARSL